MPVAQERQNPHKIFVKGAEPFIGTKFKASMTGNVIGLVL